METVGFICTLNICVLPILFLQKKHYRLIQRSTTNSTHKQHLPVCHLGYIQYMYKQYIFIKFLDCIFNVFG